MATIDADAPRTSASASVNVPSPAPSSSQRGPDARNPVADQRDVIDMVHLAGPRAARAYQRMTPAMNSTLMVKITTAVSAMNP